MKSCSYSWEFKAYMSFITKNLIQSKHNAPNQSRNEKLWINLELFLLRKHDIYIQLKSCKLTFLETLIV